MTKTIHTTDNNEYSEPIKEIWEELKCYPAKDLQPVSQVTPATIFMQHTGDNYLLGEQLFSISLHTFIHVQPHGLLAACCSNTFGSHGYLL